MNKPNAAQQILIALGGTACLVAGYQGHYWADAQTPKKTKQRTHRIGGFGKALADMQAKKNSERLHQADVKKGIVDV